MGTFHDRFVFEGSATVLTTRPSAKSKNLGVVAAHRFILETREVYECLLVTLAPFGDRGINQISPLSGKLSEEYGVESGLIAKSWSVIDNVRGVPLPDEI